MSGQSGGGHLMGIHFLQPAKTCFRVEPRAGSRDLPLTQPGRSLPNVIHIRPLFGSCQKHLAFVVEIKTFRARRRVRNFA